MTKVHVVTRKNRHLYEDTLQKLFRIRHDIFVDERGWKDLGRRDKLDVDAYDNDNAIYLIAIDNDRIVGGQRLYPTALPHMMTDVFPHLVTREVQKSSCAFEWTRYFVIKERRMGRTDCRLLAALQEFCLDEGITEVTAVVEMWWLPRWHQAGFKVKPLGLPSMVAGQSCIAASISISEESLDRVRQVGGLRGSDLMKHGLRSPILDQVIPHAA
jgi:acyl-homoserine lactone synthase